MAVDIHGVCIESLTNKLTGERIVGPLEDSKSALDLVYPGGDTVPVAGEAGSVRYLRVNDSSVEAVCNSWNGDGVVRFSLDEETGDLLIEPSGYSGRPGLRAVRWKLTGIAAGSELVAPFFQGVKLPFESCLISGRRWEWPKFWEAALAIVHRETGGLYVYCQDNQFRYKSLQVGEGNHTHLLGFDTESYGPLHQNRSAGGITWRINVYDGDWTQAASVYRKWLWAAYGLNKVAARIPEWADEIKFAVSWCPTSVDVLDALAARLDPSKVLLHVPNWREDQYDENYPRYVASVQGAAFIKRAREMGFHVMPHFNSIDMDPQNPVFHAVRDFVYQHLETGVREGWSWSRGQTLGVPSSNKALVNNRDKKVMVKIHPGLKAWRTILKENIAAAVRTHGLEAVFTDVTLNTGNLMNCLVDNMTSTEGMWHLLRELGEIDKGLVVGGEGRNEVIAQGQAFAQAHLLFSWHSTVDGLAGAQCDLGNRLYGDLCRCIGYSGLSGSSQESEQRIGAHEDQGTIPTITVSNAGEIINPNPVVKRLLEKAAGD